MYQAKIGRRPWRLDLLLLLFLHQDKKRPSTEGGEVFSGYIDNSRKSSIWPASLTPWFSFAFFSCIKARKEDHEVRKSCVKTRKQDHEARKIFLMGPSFLFLRKEKKQKKLKPSSEGGEVWPDTSRIAEGLESLKLRASKYVPGQTWLASLTPWSSFAFFSSIKRRKEDHEAGKIFLMGPSFLSLRKEKKQKKLKPSAEGGEVFPGTSRIAEGPEFLRLLTSKFMRSRMASR